MTESIDKAAQRKKQKLARALQANLRKRRLQQIQRQQQLKEKEDEHSQR